MAANKTFWRILSYSFTFFSCKKIKLGINLAAKYPICQNDQRN